MTTDPHRYADADIDAIWKCMRERRDMRHFLPETLPEGCLERLVDAAQLAPSVGFMQPWRFLRITDRALRDDIRALVEAERLRTAAALPSRNREFLELKIEGLQACAEVLAVVLMPQRERHVIGRRTMPQMDLASVGCAVQNMWLAARAEGVGLGWVSFFAADDLARLLALPDGASPVALLCVGRVAAFYPQPMLEQAGWGHRLARHEVLFENRWPAGAGGTVPAY